ncbi:hypothetical protein NC651_032350 [Populus alba x Populus x berolinensis]|nr:hypothetical protein NC651_032350 [Populus alba x Populus x berolinensis]
MKRINKTPVLVHRILYLSNLPLVILEYYHFGEHLSTVNLLEQLQRD